MKRKEATITYKHGSKYTKAWIGNLQFVDGGGFRLSHLYNGGKFISKSRIEHYIYNVLPYKYPTIRVVKIELID